MAAENKKIKNILKIIKRQTKVVFISHKKNEEHKSTMDLFEKILLTPTF